MKTEEHLVAVCIKQIIHTFCIRTHSAVPPISAPICVSQFQYATTRAHFICGSLRQTSIFLFTWAFVHTERTQFHNLLDKHQARATTSIFQMHKRVAGIFVCLYQRIKSVGEKSSKIQNRYKIFLWQWKYGDDCNEWICVVYYCAERRFPFNKTAKALRLSCFDSHRSMVIWIWKFSSDNPNSLVVCGVVKWRKWKRKERYFFDERLL